MKNIYTNDLERVYPVVLGRLEDYVFYCLRCLHRVGIFPVTDEFAWVTIPRENGSVGEAVVYPASSVKEETQEIKDPMFFYGFKMDWDFRNLSTPICVTFCKTYEELVKC